jgi:hypothetical protein
MSSININDFTLDELEKLENLTGFAFTDIAENFGRPKVLKAVLWLHAIRTNPAAKIEDFANMTLSEASNLIVGEDDPKA